MHVSDRGSSQQDAVDSIDSLRKPEVLNFTSETEAEQWEQDGRIDDWEPSGDVARPTDER